MNIWPEGGWSVALVALVAFVAFSPWRLLPAAKLHKVNK